MATKYTLSKSLPKNFGKVARKTTETVFLGKSIAFVEKSLKALKIGTFENINLSDISFSVYLRIRFNNVFYTSLLYKRPKKLIDYFIELNDGTIGMARFYFEFENKISVLIEQFEVIESIYHIDKVLQTKKNILAPIDNIDEKFIFMKVGLNQYIVSPPNPYENE